MFHQIAMIYEIMTLSSMATCSSIIMGCSKFQILGARMSLPMLEMEWCLKSGPQLIEWKGYDSNVAPLQ
jgi:hypothetical protein